MPGGAVQFDQTGLNTLSGTDHGSVAQQGAGDGLAERHRQSFPGVALTVSIDVWKSRRCPLLAQSRHGLAHRTCPLLGVKRTWPFAESPLSRSLLGAKRTCLFALHMSAYDQSRHRRRTSGRLRAISRDLLFFDLLDLARYRWCTGLCSRSPRGRTSRSAWWRSIHECGSHWRFPRSCHGNPTDLAWHRYSNPPAFGNRQGFLVFSKVAEFLF